MSLFHGLFCKQVRQYVLRIKYFGTEYDISRPPRIHALDSQLRKDPMTSYILKRIHLQRRTVSTTLLKRLVLTLPSHSARTGKGTLSSGKVRRSFLSLGSIRSNLVLEVNLLIESGCGLGFKVFGSCRFSVEYKFAVVVVGLAVNRTWFAMAHFGVVRKDSRRVHQHKTSFMFGRVF